MDSCGSNSNCCTFDLSRSFSDFQAQTVRKNISLSSRLNLLRQNETKTVWRKHICVIPDDESNHKCNRVYKAAYSKGGGQGSAAGCSAVKILGNQMSLPKTNGIVSASEFDHQRCRVKVHDDPQGCTGTSGKQISTLKAITSPSLHAFTCPRACLEATLLQRASDVTAPFNDELFAACAGASISAVIALKSCNHIKFDSFSLGCIVLGCPWTL